MTRVILTGALGRMGRMIAGEIASDESLSVTGCVEAPGHPGVGTEVDGIRVVSSLEEIIEDGDLVVDFTCPEAAMAHVAVCAAAGRPFVSGTTGLTEEQLETAMDLSAKIPIMISPNMSAGVNLLFKIVQEVAAALPDFDAEIVEIHHNRKKDSPSGTATKLAANIASVHDSYNTVYGRKGFVGERPKNEIGMHSLRGGDVIGEHQVIFVGEGERFELTHRAHSRRTFARGTLRAIKFMAGQKPGFYSMKDVLGL
ncbi:MAG: 4-hydroxy-tetrahydrodipicolinate reductase [Candidatus Krumholzibacteria bacterium]|nr:4-hydroxy-tetrahydrodipicolinate reductase [Candidatus Krumholzibacteria bacterium]